jgi:ribosomal subunit interface protein
MTATRRREPDPSPPAAAPTRKQIADCKQKQPANKGDQMNIQITGRHMETGDALRSHVEDRCSDAVSKYFERPADVNVTFSKQGHNFEAACSLHLDSGVYLHASGSDGDVYLSFDQSIAKIEKQLRRYKRRLKSHHDSRRTHGEIPGAPEKILAPETDHEELPADYAPVIIAENNKVVHRLSVSEAVMQLEVGEQDFVLFRTVSQDRLNLVYKRSDQNIGWLELDADKAIAS